MFLKARIRLLIILICVLRNLILLPNAEIFSGSANISPLTTKGMIIDAGSGGSRLHIYSWKPRIFHTLPPPLSYPEANEKWNGKVSPGIATFVDSPDQVSAHLAQLIDFAKASLVGYENDFHNFPIYFKATGGMRELEYTKREEIIKYVRQFLSDKTFCPFYFRDDFARVISGEEEAIFSWAATNFLMGTLLPASRGTGSVLNITNTYGTLDLGGASTQIAFYVPSQDINEGLYSLQIGGQKHWNVYTKSFLQFGVNSARLRLMNEIADEYVNNPDNADTLKNGNIPNVVNFCFHSGYSENAKDSNNVYTINIRGPTVPNPNQLQYCMDSVRLLMEKKYGIFCDKIYHGDCSIAGSYQPPLPDTPFIGTSSYTYPWKFLMMPTTSTLDVFQTKANDICAKKFPELMFYYESNHLDQDSNKLADYIPYYCFLSSYVLVLLREGYKFKNQTLTVIDEINGNQMGWALGAILYEINELPWELEQGTVESHPWAFVLGSGCFGFLLGAIAAFFIYRELADEKRIKPSIADDIDTADMMDGIPRVPTIELMDMINHNKQHVFNLKNNNNGSSNNQMKDHRGIILFNNKRHNSGSGFNSMNSSPPISPPGSPSLSNNNNGNGNNNNNGNSNNSNNNTNGGGIAMNRKSFNNMNSFTSPTKSNSNNSSTMNPMRIAISSPYNNINSNNHSNNTSPSMISRKTHRRGSGTNSSNSVTGGGGGVGSGTEWLFSQIIEYRPFQQRSKYEQIPDNNHNSNNSGNIN